MTREAGRRQPRQIEEVVFEAHLPKIEVHGLSVPDVQVAIGLGREARSAIHDMQIYQKICAVAR